MRHVALGALLAAALLFGKELMSNATPVLAQGQAITTDQRFAVCFEKEVAIRIASTDVVHGRDEAQRLYKDYVQREKCGILDSYRGRVMDRVYYAGEMSVVEFADDHGHTIYVVTDTPWKENKT